MAYGSGNGGVWQLIGGVAASVVAVWQALGGDDGISGRRRGDVLFRACEIARCKRSMASA